jgi:hypothetical protein
VRKLALVPLLASAACVATRQRATTTGDVEQSQLKVEATTELDLFSGQTQADRIARLESKLVDLQLGDRIDQTASTGSRASLIDFGDFSDSTLIAMAGMLLLTAVLAVVLYVIVVRPLRRRIQGDPVAELREEFDKWRTARS